VVHRAVYDELWNLQAYIGYSESLGAVVVSFRGTDSHSLSNWWVAPICTAGFACIAGRWRGTTARLAGLLSAALLLRQRAEARSPALCLSGLLPALI
jgi:hypothetical protein